MKKIKDKTERMLEIEKEFGEKIEILLHRMYVDESRIIKDIMTALSIDRITVYRWLRKAGLYSHRLKIH